MDYREYRFSRKEYVENCLLFLLGDAMISYLFYRSVPIFFLGLLLLRRFLRMRKQSLCRKRKQELEEQFLMAMQTVTTSLTAGYSVETAFEDTLKELPLIYREDDMIVQEFRGIVSKLQMNQNLEELLQSLAVRSGIEDVRNFAEIFAIAKRSGGNLIAIIRNTIQSIGQKNETRKEIQVVLVAKKMEQNMMSIIPCLILFYVQTVSPGFLDGMYHNPTGIVIMTVSLAVYAGAVFWGRKIVDIEV